MKTVKFLALVILIWSSQAIALSPMGPPIPDIDVGQYGIDFGYGYGEVDVKASGYGVSATLSGVDFSTIFAQLNYGIAENWQGSFRLGTAEIEGDSDFTWGLGTKVGLGEHYGLDWGALFQINWFDNEEAFTVDGYSGIMDFEAYEIQLALGPTYKTDNFSIYGGPFLHFIEGDLELLGLTFDLEQESVIGGYVGISTEIAENTDLNLEFQATGNAQTIGLKLAWRF